MITKLNYLAESISNLDLKWQELIMSHTQLILDIDAHLDNLSRDNTIYPPKNVIFQAMQLVPPQNVKVVIMGQDPYHKEKQANGLAFAVNRDIKIPLSLKNILKELAIEYPEMNLRDTHGDLLLNWAKQGVLLLNSTLAVIKGKPNSLQYLGFETITDKIIEYLSTNYKNIVFMLWGSFAIKKSSFINTNYHHILTSAHPSPLSANRGFFNCNHFRLCNEYLIKHNKTPIDWTNTKVQSYNTLDLFSN